MARARVALAGAWLAWASSGCGAGPPRPLEPVGTSPPAPVEAPPRDEPERRPSDPGPAARRALEALEVPGFLPALVAAPAGPGPHPVVVATHGAGGTPDWYCDKLPELLGGSAFVLCPRGRAISRFEPDGGFYYPDHHALAKELGAALAAFAARYGARADLDGPLFFGFSQGATMGVPILHGFKFRAAILVEGGYDGWTVALARAFHAAGGRRVLVACGRASCSKPGRASVQALERGGVGARLVAADGTGHTFGGAVEAGVVEALPWLLEGDDRFRPRP
jgi:predicted esterase